MGKAPPALARHPAKPMSSPCALPGMLSRSIHRSSVQRRLLHPLLFLLLFPVLAARRPRKVVVNEDGEEGCGPRCGPKCCEYWQRFWKGKVRLRSLLMQNFLASLQWLRGFMLQEGWSVEVGCSHPSPMV